MRTEDWIVLNNEKREKLTKENEKVYGDMLVYLRMSNKSQDELEPLLVELLDHLLDAQQHGKTAEDVFGKDTKAFCDELLASVGVMKKKELASMLIPSAIIGLGMWLLTSGTDGKLEYSLISLIGTPIAAFLWLVTIIGGLRFSTFKSKKTGVVVLFVTGGLATAALLAVALLDYFYGKTIFTFDGMPFYFLMIVTAIALLIVDYKTFGIRGVLFAALFIGSEFIASLPMLEEKWKLGISLSLLFLAFFILMKVEPKQVKKQIGS